MKPAAVRIGVGTRFVYDGEVLEVIAMRPVAVTPEVLARELRTDNVRRLALKEIGPTDRCHLLTDDPDVETSHCTDHPAAVKWAAVSEQASAGSARSGRRRARGSDRISVRFRGNSNATRTAVPLQKYGAQDETVLPPRQTSWVKRCARFSAG